MNPRAGGKADLAWSVCLALGTFIYLQSWPRDLNWYDESVLLYEARRILEGDVPYRDFFEIVTPGAWYVMAGVFGAFGASIETARTTMSVLHALSVIVIYCCARSLGLTRVWAALPAVAYVALCYPNCAYASPHWFATFFALVLLLGLLSAATSGPLRLRWMFVSGMLAGMLLAVQQQRGFALAAGVPLIVLVDSLFVRRVSGAPQPFARPLVAYVAGGLVVGVPVLVYLLAVPGFAASYHALVEYPLSHYAPNVRTRWGWYVQFPGIVWPWLFQYVPMLLPVGAVVVVAEARRGAELRRLRRLTVLLLFCALSIPTILHYPDYLRIALIAPFFFILAADLVGWGAREMRAPRWVRVAVAAGLMAGLAYQATRNLLEHRQTFPLSHPTAFGDVSFTNATRRALFIDRVRQVLDGSPSKEIFVYPYYPGIYLLTGARNATRYSLLISGYSSPAHFREIIATLESKRTPFVAFGLSDVPEPNDFTTYLESTYREVPLEVQSAYHLFQRKDE